MHLGQAARQRETHAEPALRAVVTPLSPSAPAPAAAKLEELPARSSPHRGRHASPAHAGAARIDHQRASTTDANEVEARASAERTPPVSKSAADKPTAPTKVPVAPAKPRNSDELDLDDLVQNALQGGQGNASDDPILGL